MTTNRIDIDEDDSAHVLVKDVVRCAARDLSGEHDSQTCDCEMCVAAEEYERRKKEEINMANEFDFENVLCVCSYPLDNEGYCVIDTDHRGIYPSGDKSRDLAATAAQLVSIGYKREQRRQALKTLAEAGVFSGSQQLPNNEYETREAGKDEFPVSGAENASTASRDAGIGLSDKGRGSLWADAATIRAAIFDTVDDAAFYQWMWDKNEMNANAVRGEFTDAVLRRLSELQSPPHGYPRLESKQEYLEEYLEVAVLLWRGLNR